MIISNIKWVLRLCILIRTQRAPVSINAMRSSLNKGKYYIIVAGLRIKLPRLIQPMLVILAGNKFPMPEETFLRKSLCVDQAQGDNTLVHGY